MKDEEKRLDIKNVFLVFPSLPWRLGIRREGYRRSDVRVKTRFRIDKSRQRDQEERKILGSRLCYIFSLANTKGKNRQKDLEVKRRKKIEEIDKKG